MGFLSDIVDTVKGATGMADPISTGLSFMGGLFGNSSNSKNAKAQMDFQERMSSTAYQRAVNDMEAAGLNKILAYGQGGASTPSGASAIISDAITPALNSGRQGDLIREQVDNMRLQKGQIASQTDLNMALEHKADQDALLSAATARNVALTGKAIEAGLPGLQNEADFQKSLGDAAPWVKHTTQWLKDVLGTAHSAKSLSRD